MYLAMKDMTKTIRNIFFFVALLLAVPAQRSSGFIRIIRAEMLW